MSNNRPDIDEKEMLRYLNGDMSREERHAFEKKLEKDPFAYEAVEGMEQFDPKEITRDLNDIRRQMQPWRRKPVMMWKIAAVVALMVLAGVSAWRLTTQDTNPVASKNEMVADSTIALNEKPAEEAAEKPAPAIADSTPAHAGEIAAGPAISSTAGASMAEDSAPASATIEVADRVDADLILDADDALAAEPEDLEVVSEVLEEVAIAEEQLGPEPEVAKEALDEILAGEPMTEKPVAVAEDNLAEKSAARSVAAKKSEADYRSQFNATGAVTQTVAPFNGQLASPDMGWVAFEKYIRRNQRHEDGIVRGIVGLSFVVNENGYPSDIKVTTPLCEPCDNEAIRLLQNSGTWAYYEGTTGTPVTAVSIQLRK